MLIYQIHDQSGGKMLKNSKFLEFFLRIIKLHEDMNFWIPFHYPGNKDKFISIVSNVK